MRFRILSFVLFTAAAFGIAESLMAAASRDDIEQCEAIVKKILDSSPNEERILSAYYTEDFAGLIRAGHKTTEKDPVGYFSGCWIMDTNGMETKILRVGPGRSEGPEIRVPVVLQHLGFEGPHKPFTKTWVFVREGNNWRARDLVRNEKESLNQELAQVFGAR